MSERGYGEDGMRPFRHTSHRRPVTRREFLGQGFLTGAALVMGPSLLGFFGRTPEARAQALDCGIGLGAGNRIPFLAFDLGGGASIAGSNVLVGGPGGQLDPLAEDGYLKLGLPVDMTPLVDPATVNVDLGLAFHSDSAFLRGIVARTSQTTRDRTNGTIFCARSANDTSNNPLNPMYGINKAGADGDLVTLIGTRASDSGGRSEAPMSMIDPAVRPTKVDRPSDATGLVDTGKLISLLDQTDATAVMRAAERLSERKVAVMNEDQLIKDLVQCTYVETTDLVSRFGDPNALDPTLDANIASILTPGELDQSEFRKTASVMKLVVNGFAGAGTVEFGGYDYHDSTRATGERKDLIAGEAMGVALEYAALVGVPLVVYILSDGSVSSTGQVDNSVAGRGKGIWKSDSSATAAAAMLVFDPQGRPALRTPPSNQIGWFRSSGNVETSSSRFADNVELLTQAAVLNYLALHDDVSDIDSVLPGHGLGTGIELDALIGFAPLPAFVGT